MNPEKQINPEDLIKAIREMQKTLNVKKKNEKPKPKQPKKLNPKHPSVR